MADGLHNPQVHALRMRVGGNYMSEKPEGDDLLVLVSPEPEMRITFTPTEVDQSVVDFLNRERVPITFDGVRVVLEGGRIMCRVHPDILAEITAARERIEALEAENKKLRRHIADTAPRRPTIKDMLYKGPL